MADADRAAGNAGNAAAMLQMPIERDHFGDAVGADVCKTVSGNNSSASSNIPEGDDLELPRSAWGRFVQRRLKAWQPVLEPRWVISLYLACGVVFIAVGVCLLTASWSVVEYSHDYTQEESLCPDGWPRGECADSAKHVSFDIEVDRDMNPPIFVYYELEDFHQNHRRYIKSKEGKQLAQSDEVIYSEADLSDCKPWVYTCDAPSPRSDSAESCPEIHRRVNYPCGLIARSIFNDSFVVVAQGPEDVAGSWTRLPLDRRKETIAWKADVQGGKFSNIDPEHRTHGGLQNQELLNMWMNNLFPPVLCEQKNFLDSRPFVPVDVATRFATRGEFNGASARDVEVVDCQGIASSSPSCSFIRNGTNFSCTGPDYEVKLQDDWGVESGHLAVWMRIAGLPTFRKLWARIDQKIGKGTRLKVYVRSNFPVIPFNGKKAFVMSTSSAFGGKNDFLGYGYAALGCCCLLFGLVFAWRHVTKPRLLGNIDLLAARQAQ